MRILLALTLFLVPISAVAGDSYYPEYRRNPVPPVVVVEDVVVDDDGAAPRCSSANDSCDDPGTSSAGRSTAARQTVQGVEPDPAGVSTSSPRSGTYFVLGG